MRFDLVMFDLDGTLIDSAGDIASSLSVALAEVGLPPRAREQVVPLIGRGIEVLVERALGGPGHPAQARVTEAFRQHYAAHPVVHTRLYPGVGELLERARACGIVLAVATNKRTDICKQILVALGLLPLFTVVLGDEPALARKPDPARVHKILALTRIAPARSLYVGDSLIDLETARNAGVSAALVTWGYALRAALAAAGPDHLIDGPAQLAALLGAT